MFSAALLRPLALALSVFLAALAVDAHEDILCQSALSPSKPIEQARSEFSELPLTATLRNRHFLGHILLSPRRIDCPGESPSAGTSLP